MFAVLQLNVVPLENQRPASSWMKAFLDRSVTDPYPASLGRSCFGSIEAAPVHILARITRSAETQRKRSRYRTATAYFSCWGRWGGPQHEQERWDVRTTSGSTQHTTQIKRTIFYQISYNFYSSITHSILDSSDKDRISPPHTSLNTDIDKKREKRQEKEAPDYRTLSKFRKNKIGKALGRW